MRTVLQDALEHVDDLLLTFSPRNDTESRWVVDELRSIREAIVNAIEDRQSDIDTGLYIEDRIRKIEKTTPWILYDYIDPEDLLNADPDGASED